MQSASLDQAANSAPSGQETADHGAPAPDFYALLVGCLPSLRQQALALTRNRADADDLVQATVSNALAAKASFAEGTNLRGWLSCIMRNRFLSDIRKRRQTCSVDDIPEASFSVAAGQEDNIALGELRHMLGRLPADQRMALIMVTVQGMSYDEVSEVLGVPVGTLKCRVFRARRLLKEWLLGEAEPPAARQPAARQPAARPLGLHAGVGRAGRLDKCEDGATARAP